jgi:uncharacterized protein YegP (UPF0339 family)
MLTRKPAPIATTLFLLKYLSTSNTSPSILNATMAGEKDKWELYEDKAGEWRWRRTAPNGNNVGASSEGYKKKGDAEANAERHGYNGNPKKLGASDKWEIYKGNDGWRWRRAATNGENVGRSTEAYSRRGYCLANAQRNGYIGS